jgi:hypothetical protein
MSRPQFAPNGHVYILAAYFDGPSDFQRELVALDTSGRVERGWPVSEPPNSTFGSVAVADDGSVYLEDCAPNRGCVLHRLGADGGLEVRGWPVTIVGCSGDEVCVC